RRDGPDRAARRRHLDGPPFPAGGQGELAPRRLRRRGRTERPELGPPAGRARRNPPEVGRKPAYWNARRGTIPYSAGRQEDACEWRGPQAAERDGARGLFERHRRRAPHRWAEALRLRAPRGGAGSAGARIPGSLRTVARSDAPLRRPARD